MPDLTSMNKVDIKMNGSGYKMPADLLELMKTSDVTTITANAKTLASRMFDEMTPKVISDIQEGIQKGIDGMSSGIPEMEKTQSDMQDACDGMNKGIKGMQVAVIQQKQALAQLEGVYDMMTGKMASGKIQVSEMTKPGMSPTDTSSKMPADAANSIPASAVHQGMPSGMAQGMQGGIPSSAAVQGMPTSILDMLPSEVKAKIPSNVLAQLKDIKTPQDVKAKITELKKAISALETKIDKTKQNQNQLKEGIVKIQSAENDIKDTISKMNVLKSAVPGAFDTGKNNYISEISSLSGQIEEKFQTTLNTGFKQMYLTSAISAIIALLILSFYRTNKTAQ
jgi:septal ring factor EnvC (AmiA/AmiB activator)